MALKWGICSTGKICSDFCSALKTLPSENHQIVAVVSRSQDTAEKFATTFDIPKTYSSYEKFAADPEIEIVYIGSAHTEHVRRNTSSLWRRYGVAVSHCIIESKKNYFQEHRRRSDGLACLVYGEDPVSIKAVGEVAESGHDIDGCVILSYSKGQKACLMYSSKVNSATNCASINGTNGSIEIKDYFWCPEEVELKTGKETNAIPVGPVPFNYPNSGGLCYEAEEVRKCIKS
ncbi:dihydrodiol dehydrogenase / D-xylose 1-dehydrogenase (NADP), partial [Mytilus galloprovincialis]